MVLNVVDQIYFKVTESFYMFFIQPGEFGSAVVRRAVLGRVCSVEKKWRPKISLWLMLATI